MENILTLNPLSLQRFSLKINFKLIWIFCSILIISLLVFYTIQVNSLTGKIYLIKNYEIYLKNLAQENENLKINFSKSNSLNNLEDYLANRSFEKVKEIKYIRILEGELVKKP